MRSTYSRDFCFEKTFMRPPKYGYRIQGHLRCKAVAKIFSYIVCSVMKQDDKTYSAKSQECIKKQNKLKVISAKINLCIYKTR
nr:hypothetical protein [Dinophyceae sp. MRD-151]